MKSKLNVKQFAKLCDVTPRTLKYYEELSIFKPREINEKNGYRVYDIQQVDEISMIRLLQEHGFSLDEIKEYQTTTDLSKRKDVLDRLKELIERKRQRLDRAEALVCETGALLMEVSMHLDEPYIIEDKKYKQEIVEDEQADGVIYDIKSKARVGYYQERFEEQYEERVGIYHMGDLQDFDDVLIQLQRYAHKNRLLLQPVYGKVVLRKDDGTALVCQYTMAMKKKVAISFGLE